MRLRDAPARGTQSRMSYQVRLAQPDDRGSLLALQAELFRSGGAGKGRAELERRFDWLYRDNPHGKAVSWVAVDEASGQVVGTTSFFPRLLALDGGTVRGALGGDGYVLPRFRRVGIGTAMHRASRRDMRALGIEVMFGTPMPGNLTPLKQAGSRNVTRVARYVRPLTPRAFGVKSPTLNALVAPWMVPPARACLEPVTQGDARVESVWRDARAGIGLGTVRDAQVYMWRFEASPSRRQRAFVVVEGGSPIAACALERVGPSQRIVELIAPAERWGAALRAICAHSRGCDTVELRLTPEQAAAHRLVRYGFIERGGAMPLNVVLPEGEPKADVFWDPRRWYVTWLETDQDTTV